MPDFSLEMALGGPVCGVDEVGRGPWAGPVLACAVVIDITCLPADIRGAIDDSKRIPARRRPELAAALRGCVTFALGEASVTEIDRLNILAATALAMRRAVEALPVRPVHALVDGNRRMGLPCPETPVVKGDGLSLSIAAASIIAKVARDALMAELAERHPGYGWERNAGYGVPDHIAGLERLGPSPQHRMSFAPVRAVAERLGLAPPIHNARKSRMAGQEKGGVPALPRLIP